MKSSLAYRLVILILSIFFSFIPAAHASTSYSYDQAGNLTTQSSSQSVLTTLTLSGSPSLTYNGTLFPFDLTTLTLTGTDQSGNPFSLSGQTITWNVVSGPTTVYGSALLISNSGQISITASVSSVTSNTLSLTVTRGTPALTYLNLGGSPPLVYNNSQLTYNLSNLTLAGSDQFNNSYSITGLTVAWAVSSGPATVSGSTLTITGSGPVGVTASINGIISNVLTLNVYQGLAPPGNLTQSSANTSSITVSWSAVSGASSYNVYENGAMLKNVTGTSYTYSNLSPGTSFTLAVCAVDSNGNPGAQSSITAYTRTAAPPLSVTSLSNNSIQVSWSPLYGVSSYNAYIYSNGSWTLNSQNITTTSYTFSGLSLSPGTTCTVGIAGVNPGGAGAIGQTSVTTPPHGSQTFTNPGNFTFTVPANVTEIHYVVVGGGGGGGYGGYSGLYYCYLYGGAGGGAAGVAIGTMSVLPNQQISGTIGSGGSGGQISSFIGATAGGNSTFGSITSYGGSPGQSDSSTGSTGGAGGSAIGGTYNGTGNSALSVASGSSSATAGASSILGAGGSAGSDSGFGSAGLVGGAGAGGGGGSAPYYHGYNYNSGGNGGNGEVVISW